MGNAHYHEQFLYPSGRPAAGVQVSIHNMPSGTLASVYSSFGLPVSNPVLVASDGYLDFYVNPGDYELRANGAAIPVTLEDEGIEVGGNVTYVHSQPIPSTSWTVNHNLNTFPEVLIKGTDGHEIEGELDYSAGPNQLIILFTQAVAGTAYIRG